MKQKSILVIEDDNTILRVLKDNLEFEGYYVLTAKDGQSGLQLALQESVDLVLLDIMFPFGPTGYDVCRHIRQEKKELPIIMLTARGQEIDKVHGLDLGADDYITKPFGLPELLARIRAVFRRQYGGSLNEIVHFGDTTLDFAKYEAFRSKKPLHLSAREFKIIKYLIEQAGDVVHRHDLLDHVWGYDNFPTTRTVDTHILELRKKLEPDPAHPQYILTIRGVGYKFVGNILT